MFIIIKLPTMIPFTVVVLFLAALQVKTNIWDNIFSETLASSPILLSDSLNFNFPLNYEGVSF